MLPVVHIMPLHHDYTLSLSLSIFHLFQGSVLLAVSCHFMYSPVLSSFFRVHTRYNYLLLLFASLNLVRGWIFGGQDLPRPSFCSATWKKQRGFGRFPKNWLVGTYTFLPKNAPYNHIIQGSELFRFTQILHVCVVMFVF